MDSSEESRTVKNSKHNPQLPAIHKDISFMGERNQSDIGKLGMGKVDEVSAKYSERKLRKRRIYPTTTKKREAKGYLARVRSIERST